MSTTHKVGSQGLSWTATAGGFSVGSPKLIGYRNPAVLRRSAENTLTLDTKYDPPGNPWLALLVIISIVVVATAGVLKGISPSVIGSTGAGGMVVTYMLIRLWRQREIKLDLGTAASEAIVDEKRRRIAFLSPIDHKSRWIVLQFKDDFSTAYGAVHDILGGKCRTGKLTGVDMVFVVVVLTIILLFVVAFGFFVLKGTVLVPAPQ